MKTTKRHFSTLTQYWHFLATYGHVAQGDNIFTEWPFPGTAPDKSLRDVWSGENLRLLFCSTEWRGYSDDSVEHWAPLIALFSGMRLEEICSLRIPQDVEIDGIAHFKVREHFDDRENDGSPLARNFEPKTTAGVRKVPIHSWLIEHGLMRLIGLRQRDGSRLLFPKLRRSGVDRKLSSEFSREFSRLKKRLGVPKTVVFHSFRVSFRTGVSQSNLPDAMLDTITGHEGAIPDRLIDATAGRAASKRGVGADYERPARYDLKVLQKVVEAFAPPIDLNFVEPIAALADKVP